MTGVDLQGISSLESEIERLSPSKEEDPVQISTRQIFAEFAKELFAKQNHKAIAGAALLTASSMCMHFLSPVIFSKFIQSLSAKDSTGKSLSQSALTALLVSCYATSRILPILRDKVTITLEQNLTHSLIQRSIDHFLHKSLDFHNKNSVQSMFNVLSKSFSVPSFGLPLVTQMAPMLGEIVIACAILSTKYNFFVGGSLLVLSAAYAVHSVMTTESLVTIRETCINAQNDAFTLIGNRLGSYKLVWDCNRVEKALEETQSAIDTMQKANVHAWEKPLQADFARALLSYSHMALVALYVGRGVQEGKYSAQDFIALIGYLSSLANLLPSFGASVNRIFASYPDVKFLFSELLLPNEILDPYASVPLPLSESPEITFENVSFSYPTRADAPVLNAFSLKIPSGKKVALISRSGAGKSTLFHLLYRYYTPASGKICIDGQEISQVGLLPLQKQICVLGQNPNLFEGTIRENILFGAAVDRKIPDEEITQLAISLGFDDLPPLDTNVGEGGRQLSGGQQQKVAVLRSLLKKTPIRLLDEATASLDTISANRMLEALFKKEEKATTIMITHKLAETRFADEIILLDAGKVVAQGSADELANHPLYQELLRQEPEK